MSTDTSHHPLQQEGCEEVDHFSHIRIYRTPPRPKVLKPCDPATLALIGEIHQAEVVTYARSNSLAGSYSIRISWQKHLLETSGYRADTTGLALDRTAMRAAYELMATWRQSAEFEPRTIDLWVDWLNRRRPRGWKNLPPGGRVRERFRGWSLVPSVKPAEPLRCNLILRGTPTPGLELAMGAYWRRGQLLQ